MVETNSTHALVVTPAAAEVIESQVESFPHLQLRSSRYCPKGEAYLIDLRMLSAIAPFPFFQWQSEDDGAYFPSGFHDEWKSSVYKLVIE